MCISMYKKTNAFLPLSMIKRKLNISSDSEMFKNENCAHLTKRKRHTAACICHTKTRKYLSERNIVMVDECI